MGGEDHLDLLFIAYLKHINKILDGKGIFGADNDGYVSNFFLDMRKLIFQLNEGNQFIINKITFIFRDLQSDLFLVKRLILAGFW